MFIVLIVLITVPMFLLSDSDFAKNFGLGGDDGIDAKEDLQANVPKNIKAVVTDKEVEVYKWADEHGVMQFSSVPPQEGEDSEKIVLSPDTNVVDAFKIPEKEQEEVAEPRVYSLSSPYTPGGMKKMVEDSKDLQETLNQRQADQDKMMQDLFKQK